MAGDWIPIETNTPRKAEVLTISKKLGISRHEVTGALVEFWGWAQEQSVDGRVDADVDAIESATSAPEGMLRAMVGVGWLEDHGDHVIIPNWEKWFGNGAKSRIKKTLRQKKWRQNAPNVDASVDGRVDANVDQSASTIEEKRREENIKTTPQPPGGGAGEDFNSSRHTDRAPAHIRAMVHRQPLPLPSPSLNVPEFISAWSEWQGHIRQKGQTLTAATAKSLLAQLSEWGVKRAVSAINYSIRSGWTSVHEDTPKNSAGSGEKRKDTVESMQAYSRTMREIHERAQQKIAEDPSFGPKPIAAPSEVTP